MLRRATSPTPLRAACLLLAAHAGMLLPAAPALGQATPAAPQAPAQPAPKAAQESPAPLPPDAFRLPQTTVIMKAPDRAGGQEKSAERGRPGQATFQAVLVEGGPRIDHGVVWRIYESKTVEGRHKLVATLKESAPSVRLAPGEYLVNAAYGRANLTRRVVVKAGEPVAERFVLNAGGLRVSALLATGETAPERLTSYDIFSDERDQAGNRIKVIGGVKPGLIVRLNAGIYHLVSTYGDANAVERADVTVEAGKLTEATLRHAAARVTLKLVASAGGEALADIRWTLLTPDGRLVKESLGALPTHIVQPGAYLAIGRQGAQSYSQQFTVGPGEVRQVEVVIR